MITLSNGHHFEYLAASGALAYDGRGWPWEWPLRWCNLIDPSLFTIVTKTLTYHPRRGNLRWSHPWSCVKTLKDGVVNAIGLTNPGFEWWLKNIAPRIPVRRYALVCSIMEDDPKRLVEMVQALNPIPIRAIELNASCPNTEHEITKNVEKIVESIQQIHAVSAHPIFLKLSIQQDYLALAKATEGHVEALSINSIPWKIAFPEHISPLDSLGGGGVSGKIAQKFTWKMVRDLSANTRTPVIGPGVWEFEDLQKIRNLGAKAISFGSIFMRYPWRSTAFVRRERGEGSVLSQGV